MNNLIYCIVLLLCISTNLSWGSEPVPFLPSDQIAEFYDVLMSEIERLDAEGIETRNRAKKTSWSPFSESLRPIFLDSQDWADLCNAFTMLQNGFVNQHSAFTLKVKGACSKSFRIQSNAVIGFEWPKLLFFESKTGKTITSINDLDIGLRFNTFRDTECPRTSEIGCADLFVSRLSRGKVKVSGRLPAHLSLNGSDGDQYLEIFYSQRSPSYSTSSQIDCSVLHYSGFRLIDSSYNTCVFKKDDIAIIKIRNFLYPKGFGGNLKCQKIAQIGAMCADIRNILKSVKSNGISKLVFDLQGNYGGTMVTSFVSAFVGNSFRNMLVQFKNTPEIQNSRLRSKLFYGSKSAEKWFEKLKAVSTTTEESDFLPPRPDFCYGSDACEYIDIAPSPNGFLAEKIVLVTDWSCASSCDDFVWSMQKFGNAQLAGNLPARDATYSRIKIAFLLVNQKIVARYFGDSSVVPVHSGEVLLAEVIIPYSRTVDEHGAMLTGSQNSLDFEASFDRHTYEKRKENAVLSAINALLKHNAHELVD